MTTEVRIRSIEHADLAAVVEILIGGSLHPESESRDDLDEYWLAVEEARRRQGEVFVADENGAVVGVCQVIVFRNIGNRGQRVAEIENVHVRSDRRSNGIGEKLITACENLARSMNCHRVQLTSNVARGDAHRFYDRLGYVASHKGFKKSLRG